MSSPLTLQDTILDAWKTNNRVTVFWSSICPPNSGKLGCWNLCS